MKKQERHKKSLNLMIMVSFLAILTIFLSGNAIGWNKYQLDSLNSGVFIESGADFETSTKTLASTSIGTGFVWGTLMMEIRSSAGFVNQSIIFVNPDSNELRAYNYDNTINLNLVDTFNSGYLEGEMYGQDFDSDDGLYDIMGVFGFEDVTNETFFKHIAWNTTSNEFVSIWNVSLDDFAPSALGVGVSCSFYDSIHHCIAYSDEFNHSGQGYGDLWEIDVDNQIIKRRYQFNWSNAGVGNKIPLVNDFDSDDNTEVIFYGNKDGNADYFMYVIDLTNGVFDSDFSTDGVTDAVVGKGNTLVTPMLIDIGASCFRDFLECFKSPLFNCYVCDEDNSFEIAIAYWDGVTGFVKLFNSAGDLIWANSHTAGSSSFCSMTQGDCYGDDGFQDVIAHGTSGTDGMQFHCIDGQTGSQDASGGVRFVEFNSGCSKDEGLILAELDNDPTSMELVYSDGIITIDDWTTSNDTFADSWDTLFFAEAYDDFMIGDLNGDTQLDFIQSKLGTTQVISTNETDANPSFIGDGADLNTCVPICIDEEVTFFARRGLDYTDPETDSAYLGVDCEGEGVGSVVWSSNDVDPQITCNYTSLGSFETKLYITDHANFPSFGESQTVGVYTSLAGCYDSGEFDESCSATVLEGGNLTDTCFTDAGLSVCVMDFTSDTLCNFCNCSSNPVNKCAVNGTRADGYDSAYFNWEGECDSWKGGLFYPICPFYTMAISSLTSIWNWIFATFFIVLTIIAMVVIGVLIFKRRGR